MQQTKRSASITADALHYAQHILQLYIYGIPRRMMASSYYPHH